MSVDSDTFVYADDDANDEPEDIIIGGKKEKTGINDSKKSVDNDNEHVHVNQEGIHGEELQKDIENNNTTTGLECCYFNKNKCKEDVTNMAYQKCLSETLTPDGDIAKEKWDENMNKNVTESGRPDGKKRGNTLKKMIWNKKGCENSSDTNSETESTDKNRFQSESEISKRSSLYGETKKPICDIESKIDKGQKASGVSYQDTENIKENYVELIKRTDKQVNDFQLHAVENQNIHRTYNKLKKLFIALSVINIILIMVVISIMPITMVTFRLSNAPPSVGNNGYIKKSQKISEEDEINDEQVALHYLNATSIKEMMLCVSCSKLRLNLYQTYWERVSIEDERCCFQDTLAMVTSIVRMQNRQNNRLYKRIRRVEHFIHNATNLSVYNATLNDDKENNDGSEDSGLFDDELNEPDTLIAIGDLINKPRSAIHLKSDGRFHKIGKNYQMKWSANTVSQGDISSTGRYIQVPTEGYYYIYSHVLFSRNATVSETRNVTLTFNLSKTNYGMSKTIERVQQRCMFREGTLEHQSTIQTIVLLDADDKLHINFPAHELAFVSRDYGAHALGVFKL